VEIVGLRDSKGVVRLCLTSQRDSFPVCSKAHSMSATVSAADHPARFVFDGVPAGTYAIAAFHDENGNGKLDKMVGMPREGFAFSENPPLRPRPPTFLEAHFQVGGDTVERLRMRYIL
jgi:uncharacterized protein (DUF2141 family)